MIASIPESMKQPGPNAHSEDIDRITGARLSSRREKIISPLGCRQRHNLAFDSPCCVKGSPFPEMELEA
ncbi:hypothetical protein [Azorhizophilus paspali]|uniref:Uncharacterized protein n=1 Tax=Azorhizophilus paspali TaxID=69963 RepID=A0ABV6SMM0_AZOPA